MNTRVENFSLSVGTTFVNLEGCSFVVFCLRKQSKEEDAEEENEASEEGL